jgi:hypothetical protein
VVVGIIAGRVVVGNEDGVLADVVAFAFAW